MADQYCDKEIGHPGGTWHSCGRRATLRVDLEFTTDDGHVNQYSRHYCRKHHPKKPKHARIREIRRETL